MTDAVLDAPPKPEGDAAPRKRNAERTRKAILAAALKEFAQAGFAGARIERIVKSAKCNIRMLYHYFGDKKGLYMAVLESAYMDLRAREAELKIDFDRPLEGFLAELIGPQWLNAGTYPSITFRSTKIEVTGPDTGKVTGDLTLHGVTKPVTLDVTYNGGYAGHPMDPHARVGFSAKGMFKRSDFGIAYGVPAPGTTMGVSDEVEVQIEAEFTGPPLVSAPPAQPPSQ